MDTDTKIWIALAINHLLIFAMVVAIYWIAVWFDQDK